MIESMPVVGPRAAPELDWTQTLQRDRSWVEQIPWPQLRNRPLRLAEKMLLREFYSHHYQDKSNYTERHPWHQEIALFRHRIAEAVFPELGKILDGGCASGEVVSAFRGRGADCWGFDLCPDLLDIVYPEARPYVRMGRMDAMPFSPEDGFKTFVSYDVIEHVPIDCLEALPDELVRLGITQIACVIANDTISVEHITIQQLPFYERLFARAGFRLLRELTPQLNAVPAPTGWNESLQRVLWGDYRESGSPRNGWNQVPGHLFFERS